MTMMVGWPRYFSRLTCDLIQFLSYKYGHHHHHHHLHHHHHHHHLHHVPAPPTSSPWMVLAVNSYMEAAFLGSSILTPSETCLRGTTQGVVLALA